ncbi:MAG: hypothetical protein RLY14_2271 [Planctomycetota bacterium]|jgi:D-amino-acid dehydrogenase
MSEQSIKDIVIVGGGVIGLSVAYYCAQRGYRVTVIERQPQLRDGCSFGNAGMIVPSHFIPLAAPGMVALGLKWMWNPESPFYVKPRLSWDLLDWGWKFWQAGTAKRVAAAAPILRDLNLASRACYEELASSGIDCGLQRKGLLMLCKTSHALHEEAATAEQAKKLGVPAEVLDASATARLDPNVTMDIEGSVYFPLDCHLQPELYVKGLEQSIAERGGKLLWNTNVNRWRIENGQLKAIETTAGEIRGDIFVLCAGAWSPETAQQLNLRIPMQAGKGYSLTLPNPRQLPSICSIFVEARMAITPMGQSLRFGGTMELSGVNEKIDPRRVRGIIKSVPKYYPAFQTSDFEGIAPWRGLRPCSPDGLPYLGRTKRYDNLVVATGHAMMGLSLAPITGRLTADIIAGVKPSIDLTLLSPDRYN